MIGLKEICCEIHLFRKKKITKSTLILELWTVCSKLSSWSCWWWENKVLIACWRTIKTQAFIKDDSIQYMSFNSMGCFQVNKWTRQEELGEIISVTLKAKRRQCLRSQPVSVRWNDDRPKGDFFWCSGWLAIEKAHILLKHSLALDHTCIPWKSKKVAENENVWIMKNVIQKKKKLEWECQII